MLNLHKLAVLREVEAVGGQLPLQLLYRHFVQFTYLYIRILCPILDPQYRRKSCCESCVICSNDVHCGVK